MCYEETYGVICREVEGYIISGSCRSNNENHPGETTSLKPTPTKEIVGQNNTEYMQKRNSQRTISNAPCKAVVSITTSASVSHFLQHKKKNERPHTPPHIKRTRSRKTIRHNLQNIRSHSPTRQLETLQQTLQRRSPHTEKHHHVHDEEFVVSCHDSVVEGREGFDCVGFFGDEEEDEGNEEGEEGNEESGKEGLYDFFFPLVFVEVAFLGQASTV